MSICRVSVAWICCMVLLWLLFCCSLLIVISLVVIFQLYLQEATPVYGKIFCHVSLLLEMLNWHSVIENHISVLDSVNACDLMSKGRVIKRGWPEGICSVFLSFRNWSLDRDINSYLFKPPFPLMMSTNSTNILFFYVYYYYLYHL